MTAIVQSARYQLGLDNAEYNRAAQAVTSANERMVASLDGVADAEVRVTQQVYKSADGFSKLEARYDRSIALEQRRQNALAQATRVAEEEGVASDRLASQIARVNARYDEQVAVLNRVRAPLQAGQGHYRNFGSAIQQAGFQVGDFAVQVASGQGVLRPFIQQGTQLISMFGPWGAVIGAAGAVVGALATSFLDLGDATKEATVAQEAHSKAMQFADDLARALNGTNEMSVLALEKTRDRTIETTRAELAAAEAKIALIEATTMQSALEQSPDDIGAALDGVQQVVAARTAAIRALINGEDGLREQLATLQFGSKGSLAPMDPFSNMGKDFTSDYYKPGNEAGGKGGGGGGGGGGTSPRATQTRAIEEQRSALTELMRVAANENELLSTTGTALAALKRDRAIEAATIQAQAAALRDYNAGLRDSPILMSAELASIQSVTAANYDLAEAQKERGDVAKEVTEETGRDMQILAGFIDQTASRIGSGLTEALATGQIEMAKLGDIGRAVLSELIQLALQLAVINPLKNWALGQDNPTADDFLGGFLGGIAGLFGGGYGNAANTASGFLGPVADGGPVEGGGTYLVGERGPELIVPPSDGFVIPNHALMPRGNGGGRPIVINNNINIEGSGGKQEQNRDLADQIQDRLERTMKSYVREVIVDETRGGGELNKPEMVF